MKAKNILRRNLFDLLLIITIGITGFYYVWSATLDAPIMDFWRYIVLWADEFEKGGVSLFNIPLFAGHSQVLTKLIMFIDTVVFDMNLQILIFAGMFILIINVILVLNYINKNIFLNIKKSYLQLLLVVPLLVVSNFNQWEILAEPFSFAFMLRVFIMLICFIFLDKYLIANSNKMTVPKLIIYFFTIFVMINYIMVGYFASFSLVLIGTILFNYFIRKAEINRLKIMTSMSIIVVVVISSSVYISAIIDSGVTKTVSPFSVIFSTEFIRGVLLAFGSSLFNYKTDINFVLIAGGVVVAFYCLSLFYYFKQEIYKQSYFPLMLICYSVSNVIIIAIARIPVFGYTYMQSSRYVVESTLGLLGIVLIFLFVIKSLIIKFSLNKEELKTLRKFKTSIHISVIVIIFSIITSALLLSMKSEFAIAKSRKEYYRTLVKIMVNIDDYSDNELGVFQANKPSYVREGVSLMKKYNLGVFKDEKFMKYLNIIPLSDIGSTLATAEKTVGFTHDKWLLLEAVLKIKTKDVGKISFTGYYPTAITGKEKGSVVIDNVTHNFTIDSENFTWVYDAPKNKVVDVRIISDFLFPKNNSDERKLTFMLIDLRAE